MRLKSTINERKIFPTRSGVRSPLYVRGKRRPPNAEAVSGRKLPKRLQSSLRRVNQAPPRCGSAGLVINKFRNRKPVSLGAVLGSNGEVERSKSVNERLNNLILLPCQRAPVVEATMAELRG